MSKGQIFRMASQMKTAHQTIKCSSLNRQEFKNALRSPYSLRGSQYNRNIAAKATKRTPHLVSKKRFYASVNNYNRDITAKATKRTPHLVSKIKHDLSHFCTIHRGRTCVGLKKRYHTKVMANTSNTNHSRIYKHNPLPVPTKATFAAVFFLCGAIGFIGNSFREEKTQSCRHTFKAKGLRAIAYAVPIEELGAYGSFVFVYLVPNAIMFYTAATVSRFLRKRSRDIQDSANIHSNNSQGRRFKDTKMFINVIFAFCIPYSTYFVYNLVKRFAGLELSYELDFTIRMSGGVLATFNSCINPMIYLFSYKDFRRELRNIICPRQVVNDESRQRQDLYMAGRSEGRNRAGPSLPNIPEQERNTIETRL
ncbi:predicted protein [Nematostella vectensis]|uniref:G-protein coupled receptors family 1 profile domain-containing protein n=1 Tax=Nematostella vectensis TaxID=45351 RepID=A7SWQ1_NEMVE|nr:predicted protein [Nematostella vectensis]|eukprot:XP_001623961.1 predicted protein [Nematostella vectensis]